MPGHRRLGRHVVLVLLAWLFAIVLLALALLLLLLNASMRPGL